MTLLRGRQDGIEVSLSGRDPEEALTELEARFAQQPSFYRGSTAVVTLGESALTVENVTRLRALLDGAGVELRALCGSADGLEALARDQGVAFRLSETGLSEAARSLVADFAGARNEIAQRRKRGEASVRRAKVEPTPRHAPELRLLESSPATVYRTGTLRGGQALHHTGNVVVVGDVNPGAELVATGDIVVFGRLAGIAHAGAQGDESARIYAVELVATQLRIATLIAAEQRAGRTSARKAEAALARDGHITIVSLAQLAALENQGASLA